ncbi:MULTISPECIES: helix-turn-helix transcriptional regulator [Bradyrhizobium]|uniref:helix-turn-helix transcriptional regulator n=1 Tax=Bradyrhizobium elkanii TaxID=29448 RepID=UPI00042876FB|nr:helix-turn-helix transcriptional regulator [Bradyrhizobium elkanii]
MQAFARHRHSHPFWQYDPDFYGERALRDSDFFTDDEYVELPMAREAFLPSGARRMMAIVLQHQDYVVTIVGHRVLNRPPFSDLECDRLETFPSAHSAKLSAGAGAHARQAHSSRSAAAGVPRATPRQIDVASWIALGKSNDEIAGILDVGVDTIKAYVKAINSKIDSDSRRAAIVIAHTTPPFADLPPLWKLGLDAWGGQAQA